jgi:dienelactone hydrolase
LYIFGYSLGSFGTWTMLSRYEGRFAAAVPISGGSPAADFVPARLVDTPVFAVQARDDDAAPASTTRGLISSILAAARQPAPIYPSASDSKDFMISNPNLPMNVSLTAQAHQFGNVTDYFVSDPQMDFMYFERATGGHSSVLSAVNSPLVYDWMFAHSTAVPEPGDLSMLWIAAGVWATTMRPASRRNVTTG